MEYTLQIIKEYEIILQEDITLDKERISGISRLDIAKERLAKQEALLAQLRADV